MKIGIRIKCTSCSYDECIEVEMPFADDGDVCPNCGEDGTGYIAEVFDVSTTPMQQAFEEKLKHIVDGDHFNDIKTIFQEVLENA